MDAFIIEKPARINFQTRIEHLKRYGVHFQSESRSLVAFHLGNEVRSMSSHSGVIAEVGLRSIKFCDFGILKMTVLNFSML